MRGRGAESRGVHPAGPEARPDGGPASVAATRSRSLSAQCAAVPYGFYVQHRGYLTPIGTQWETTTPPCTGARHTAGRAVTDDPMCLKQYASRKKCTGVTAPVTSVA